MKTVVITGGAAGVGKSLAAQFLKNGHNVVVTGRTANEAESAGEALTHEAIGGARVLALPCGVTDAAAFQDVWDKAVETFGQVDIWIPADETSTILASLLETPPDELKAMVETNVTGVMLSAQTALKGMKAQGQGTICLVTGIGSRGRIMPGMIAYVATKRALAYFAKNLFNETRKTTIKVYTLSPGISVTSEFVQKLENALEGRPPAEKKRVLKSLNLLGDEAETTTGWIVDRILEDPDSGTHIAWMTRWQRLWRKLRTPIKPREVISAADTTRPQDA